MSLSLNGAAAPELEVAGGGGGVYSRQTRNLAALAAIGVQSGSTRYDLPAAVDHPGQERDDGDAARPRIPGEIARPLRAGRRRAASRRRTRSASRASPTRRAVCSSAGRSRSSAEGSFVGQGMTDPLPDGGTATVPFAIERRVAVEVTRENREEGARLYHIEAGSADRRARRGVADEVPAEERRRAPREADDQTSRVPAARA